MNPAVRKVLSHIAVKRLNIPTLETRGSDSLDFYEVSVWSINDALCQAYSAGKLAAQTPDIRPYASVIKRLLKRSDDLIASIEGTTDQFQPEVMHLQEAAIKAEQVLKGGAA
jgi:hypothetical protein